MAKVISNPSNLDLNSWINKAKTGLDSIFKDFDLSSNKLIEIFSLIGVGFFTGFLFKKYSKYAVAALIIFVLGILTLESFELVQINWGGVKDVVGVSADASVGSVFDNYVTWVKSNLVSVFGAFVGFLIGYKVG